MEKEKKLLMAEKKKINKILKQPTSSGTQK
jgi:hypothetical protein